MSQFLTIIEDILADPNVRSINFILFGFKVDLFYPESRISEDNVRRRTSKSDRRYNLNREPDEQLKMIFPELYQWTSTKNAMENPLPEGEYEAYPEQLPDGFQKPCLIRFTFPKIGRDRVLYFECRDVDKIEGFKHILIQKLVLYPYNA